MVNIDSVSVVRNGCISVSYHDGKTRRVDYLYTHPIGYWSNINFDLGQCYIDFLDNMVFQTIDVKRKITKLMLTELMDRVSYSRKEYTILRKIMNASSILDPTFRSPYLNLGCRWQRDFIKTFCMVTLWGIISNCRNEGRLFNFSCRLEELARLR